MYDKLNNDSLTSKLEREQFMVCIATTGAIKGTAHEWLNKEHILESEDRNRD